MEYRFGDYTLDVARRELRCRADAVAVEPQVFDLLTYLIRQRDRVVTKDDLIAAVWGGRIVSDSTLTSRINAARKAIGDSGEAQRLIRTVPRRGLRFVSDVIEAATAQALRPSPSSSATSATAPPARPPLRQDVRFCLTTDGVSLAYASVGEGPTLVRTGHWLTHLEYDWESPVWSPFLRALAEKHRLVRYDARGNGLSDWDIAEFSLGSFVNDLECVVDAAGLDRFALFGMSQGAAISVAYAVRHPDRVTHIVLCGGFVRGLRKRGTPEQLEQADAVLTLMRHGWGQENPAFRQIFTSRMMPDARPEQVQWLNELQRKTTSSENAVRIRKTNDEIDISGLLPQVQAATLVMHMRDDAIAPFEEGRKLAAGIPGARFVALEGRNHILLEGDPGWNRFFEEIATFLKS